METQDKVAEKTEILVPYNILPLDPDSANQAIMRFPEVGSVVSYMYIIMIPICFCSTLGESYPCYFQIQAAVFALRNTRGLAWPKDYKKRKDEDILDWLGAMYGFQVNYNLLFSHIMTYVLLTNSVGLFATSCTKYRSTMWQIRESIWSYCLQMYTLDNSLSPINNQRWGLIG